MPALPQGAASHPDDWREDMIAKAEVELKAAMASGDPERLKAAIANASATVAKARARGSTVVKKQQVLHGARPPLPMFSLDALADSPSQSMLRLRVRIMRLVCCR